MFKLLLVSLCCLQVRALSLSSKYSSQAEATAEMFQENPQGLDHSQAKIHAPLKSFADFCKMKQITPSPVALTALAALRFGGMSMTFNKKSVPFDHDMDFVLTFNNGKNPTVDETRDIVKEFANYVTDTTGLKAVACQGSTNYIALKPGQLSNGAWNFWVYVKLPGASTGNFFEEVSSHLMDVNVPSPLRRSAGKMSDSLRHLWHSSHASVPDAACFTDLPGEDEFVTFDLWVDFEGKAFPQIAKAPVQNAKPFVLAGVPFRNLATEETISDEVRDVICSDQSAALFGTSRSICSQSSKIEFCSLAHLGKAHFDHRVFSMSKIDSVTADLIMKDCALKLDGQGFASLAHCWN